jgi:hypothetical protein
MQYPHLVSCVVVDPYAISSLVVPNLALQKVPPPIQNEHGNAMEDNEWAHKGKYVIIVRI